MFLNVDKFVSELQKKQTDAQVSIAMGISRTQLWRAKRGRAIGERFISGFKRAFPKASIDAYFFAASVTQK